MSLLPTLKGRAQYKIEDIAAELMPPSQSESERAADHAHIREYLEGFLKAHMMLQWEGPLGGQEPESWPQLVGLSLQPLRPHEREIPSRRAR